MTAAARALSEGDTHAQANANCTTDHKIIKRKSRLGKGAAQERGKSSDTYAYDASSSYIEVIWTTPREVLGVLPVMLFWVFGSTPNTAIPLLWELCPSVSF